MKRLLLIYGFANFFTCVHSFAQQPAAKPPVGIPSDAKLAGSSQSISPTSQLPASAQGIIRNYHEGIASARRRAIQQLEDAKRSETQLGHLEAALAINGVIKALVNETTISLIDLPPKKESSVGSEQQLTIGGTQFLGRGIVVDGEPCTRWIGAHAPSRVVYAIPPGITAFSAIGVRPGGDSTIDGTWCYIVKIDGNEVFRSKALKEYPKFQVPIDVRIPPAAKEIELIIDPMKDMRFDHSVWALPLFR